MSFRQSRRTRVGDARPNRLWPVLLAALLVPLISGCGREGPEPEPAAERVAAESGPRTATDVAPEPAQAQPESPLEPLELLDRAERARQAGDLDSARVLYGQIVSWAASDPLSDGWGGTALAPYAMWRWADYASQLDRPDADEVIVMLEAERALRRTKLCEGMLATSFLDALPQLQEATLLHLAILADASGLREAAQLLFLDYLAVARGMELSADAESLRQSIIEAQWATADHIDLMRARRLRALRHFDESERLLRQLTQSPIENVRLEAMLDLAELRWDTHADDLSRSMREEVAELLGRVIAGARDPEVIQKAYFERAIVQLREGEGQSIEGFLQDMETLMREFPSGVLVPETLYQLAQYHARRYRLTGDAEAFDKTLEFYGRLRAFPTPHGREDSMYYRPALALYTRGSSADGAREGDFDEAVRLLEQLEATNPGGPFHLPSLLWRGRIAEQRGDTDQARETFERLAGEDPYGYYGIRAKMHLESGAAAATQLLPGESTSQQLGAAFAASEPLTGLSGASPYHERLRVLTESGQYARGLEALTEFRRGAVTPLRDAELEALDERGLLADIVVLLAARLNGFAARDHDPTPDNLFEISSVLGSGQGDWPAALFILTGGRGEPGEAAAVRGHSAYLVTAYPNAYRNEIIGAANRGGAPADLLYTVVRRESLFDSSAVSSDGAIGFFQFMPNTFDALDERWGLLAQSDKATRDAFLFDGRLNMALGARWFGDELLPRYDIANGLLFAVMDHNAGAPAVRRWRQEWSALGRDRDIEFMIETARYAETRGLARGMLGDLSIVRSANLLEIHDDNSPNP